MAVCAATGVWAGTGLEPGDQHMNRPNAYNVVWETPSHNHTGSMPLGNGEVAVNAWVEPNGDLCFYVARTDAWGDNGRLLKIGRIRVCVAPPVWRDRMPYRQTLSLHDAALLVRCGDTPRAATIRLWVDANHPVVCVEVNTAEPTTATATIELWRTEPSELPTIEVSDVHLRRGSPGNCHAPTVVEADTILEDLDHAIGWVHHNTKSVGPRLTMQIQGLEAFPMQDPLLDRTFGALIATENGRPSKDGTRLQSPPGRRHVFTIPVLTQHPATIRQWVEQARRILEQTTAIPHDTRKQRHDEWWRDFWNRSWIHVTARDQDPPTQLIPENRYPLRIGFDQHGENRFEGAIARVSVWKRALTETQLHTLAAADRNVLPVAENERIGSWNVQPGTVLNVNKEDFTGTLTIEAWIRPEKMPRHGGRIVDKVTPGKDDGFLLDTYPGNSLRFIVGGEVLHQRDMLEPGTWHHVAATVDQQTGRLTLYHNGDSVAATVLETGSDAFAVSRAYALQRFIDACAGRGRYPIKFNGSLFTVAAAGRPGDADYRRWGPGYWWQNTRLPYLSMCTSGDTEMMRPLFAMYGKDLMPLFSYRTKATFGHAGAFIPECIYFWGAVFSETYGWTPASEREDKLQHSRYHKWEWVAGPELVWMMLDYFDHTENVEFLNRTLLPAAQQILLFFHEHYEADEDGTLVMHPAQALETWWDCTDPMPEIAGLHGCTERLLALPNHLTTAEQRAFWRELRAKLPPLPTRTIDGTEMLAPAAAFANKRNSENPELYAVFPFRQIALGRPNIEFALQALKHRENRGHFGWRQDDIFMAMLGLAEEARKGLVKRARKRDAGSRFPAFWGPNYDWVPDQDHGGVLMKTLQAMIMQTDGDRIMILPAWPKTWNVRFRLHAPKQTVIEGHYANGDLRTLSVTPESRRPDVVIVRPDT